MPVSISVIIPTYKDSSGLKKCLKSLQSQTLGEDQFEIVVVNNDPAGTALDIIAFPINASVISEARPGSYVARNSGARTASAPLFVFTDSDCQPSPQWLERITEFYSAYDLECSDCPLLAGGVELFPHKAGHFTFAEAYDYFVGLNQHIYVRKGVAATANLSVPRNLFESLGGFDERMFSGGDTDFCSRARQSGIKLHYDEAAAVYHPLRYSAAEVLRKDRRLLGARLSRARAKTVLMALAPPFVRMYLILTERDAPRFVRFKAIVFLARVWLARGLEVGRLLLSSSAARER